MSAFTPSKAGICVCGESLDHCLHSAEPAYAVRRNRCAVPSFSDSKYDLLVIVREGPDGAVLWNVLNRERKAMNTMRTGRLVHGHGRKAGDDVG